MAAKIVWQDYPNRVLTVCSDCLLPLGSNPTCANCAIAARIPLSKVPPEALDFGRRLLGEDRALLYFTRFYGAERKEAA